MKNKSLTLQDVQISYDSKNAGIVITSKDPAIKGKPFQVKLYADTPSYATLLELLTSEGLVDLSDTEIASKLFINSPQETVVPNADPRTSIRIGESFNGEPVDLNLNLAPHSFIAGIPGSGKSIVQRSILAHALLHENIEPWGIDLKRVELSVYFQDARDHLAVTLDGAFSLTGALESELEARFRLMEQLGIHNFLDTDLKAIYFLVDEAGLLFEKSGTKTAEAQLEDAKKRIIQERIGKLASLGRRAGVFLFLASQRGDDVLFPGELKANLGTRILMGNASATAINSILGMKPRFGGGLLRNNGRGILQVNGRQQLFQAYFLPMDKVKS